MKKLILIGLPFAICIAMQGCCPKCPEVSNPNCPDSQNRTKNQISKIYTLPTNLMSTHDADMKVYPLINKLNSDPKQAGDIPQLGQNIWQYIFPTTDLDLAHNNTWILHKAYDRNTSKVCFVLEIISQGQPTKYYKGAADCPRICGYQHGGLSLEAKLHYQDNFLMKIERPIAESYLLDPQQDRANSIQINWEDGIEYCAQHNANLVQVIYGTGATDINPGDALFFPIDQYGHPLGGAWIIPQSQICMYTAQGTCGLQ